MSSDTTKDASVVDSSVTEWKHDTGNLEDTGSPRYKVNEDACHSGPEEQENCGNQGGTSNAIKKDKLYSTRYFIIKSLNYQNIQLSIEKGIWATQVMNEPILEEAFHNSGMVILIFSVNMSGFFQGYAQMMSSVGWRRDNVWSQGSGGSSPWGRSFRVKWLQLHDLPFQKTLHLKNPLNQYKPVKISRDCQELPEDIGEALCKLLDGISEDYHPRRNDFSIDCCPYKRPCIEASCSSRDGEYRVPSIHINLAHVPLLYPSLLHQHQAETNQIHVAHRRPTRNFASENSPLPSGSSEDTWTKQSCFNASLTDKHVDQDHSSFDAWGLSAERSPLASTLTEEDILDMTYEEYLEVHSRSTGQLSHVARVPRKAEASSKECDGGWNLDSQSKKKMRTRSHY